MNDSTILRLQSLQKSREKLIDGRSHGTLSFRDSNGEQVVFKSDSEMSAALKALDAEIARLEGRAPASTILFRTSKGI